MEKGLAIITGADGGMGQVITAALAKEGYPVIMACLDPEKAVPVCTRIRQETGNTQIEVRRIDLASLSSVNNFTGQLLKEGRPVSRLMNNAGILTTPVRKTEDGLETILFRPFIKTPAQGAATAIHLALSDEAKDKNGCCYANCKKRNVSERIRHHAQQKQLWDDTEILLRQKGIRF